MLVFLSVSKLNIGLTTFVIGSSKNIIKCPVLKFSYNLLKLVAEFPISVTWIISGIQSASLYIMFVIGLF